MPLHFKEDEFCRRNDAARSALRSRGLSGLLVFRQESMYWLTGYDTGGYSQFQCMWFGVDGSLVLLTRSSDIRQAKRTSFIEDIRVWKDLEGANPAQVLRGELEAFIKPGMEIGVEYDSHTLNGRRGKWIDAAFSDMTLVDASDTISALRVVKSDAELDYARRAGQIADAAWYATLGACLPGRSESDLLGANLAAVLQSGGDPPAGRIVCGAGDNAMLCRYFSGKGTIQPHDQVTVEFGAGFRHYHAALMRTIVVGTPSQQQIAMHDATRRALKACVDTMRPGKTFGDLFSAHAHVCDEAGYQHARLNACGYSLGATYPPTWMDWPMCYAENPVVLQSGMVIFLHMILFDDHSGLAMSLGETFIVQEGEPERLSNLDHNLVVVAP